MTDGIHGCYFGVCVLTLVLFPAGSELGWGEGLLVLSPPQSLTRRGGAMRNKRPAGAAVQGEGLGGGCGAQARGLEDTQRLPTRAAAAWARGLQLRPCLHVDDLGLTHRRGQSRETRGMHSTPEDTPASAGQPGALPQHAPHDPPPMPCSRLCLGWGLCSRRGAQAWAQSEGKGASSASASGPQVERKLWILLDVSPVGLWAAEVLVWIGEAGTHRMDEVRARTTRRTNRLPPRPGGDSGHGGPGPTVCPWA